MITTHLKWKIVTHQMIHKKTQKHTMTRRSRKRLSCSMRAASPGCEGGRGEDPRRGGDREAALWDPSRTPAHAQTHFSILIKSNQIWIEN